MQCPSCERVQEPHLLCVECQTPIASDLDYFTTLGLPRRLLIDSATLEERYHDLGRRVHPDRFANASARIGAASLRATALLTRAYRTLQDPTTRGHYWLELNGQKLAENNQQVPPNLAAMVFEIQDQIADFRQANNEEFEWALSNLQTSRDEVRLQLDETRIEMNEVFRAFDECGNEPPKALFEHLKLILAKIAYMKTLIRDIEKALDIRAAA
jgi:molecular chaperone HscB